MSRYHVVSLSFSNGPGQPPGPNCPFFHNSIHLRTELQLRTSRLYYEWHTNIEATKRYDDLQRAFRDCHLALEGLKASLGVGSPNSGSFGSSPYGQSTLTHSASNGGIPKDILRAALSRLDDYTEDARVELEIRIGDEALLARGYEALLAVPGALAAASTPPSSNTPSSASNLNHNLNGHGLADGHLEDEADPTQTQTDIEAQITAFISGTDPADPAVRRAKEALERKLADVQHDVAVLKRAVHDPESLFEGMEQPPPSAGLHPAASSSSSSLVEAQGQSTSSGGGGWSSWILPRGSSSRPASPAPTPHSSTFTFGAIMTDPRLRHSPSTGSFHSVQNPQSHQNPQGQQSQAQRARKTSFFSFGVGGASEPVKDPLAALNLRVPMPNFSMLGGAGAGGGGPLSAGLGGFGLGSGAGPYGGLLPLSPTSPLGSMGAMGQGSGGTRSRTVSSTMYMLGLGAASGSGSGKVGRSVSASSGMGMGVGMSRQASTSSTSSLGWGHSRQVSEQEIGEGLEDEEDEEEDDDVE